MGVKVREKIRGSGQWWIFVNHEGKRTSRKIGGKRAAQAVAAKVQAELALGQFNIKPERTVPTFKGYVFGDPENRVKGWIDKQGTLFIKYSTKKSYMSIISKHLIPWFGSTRLDQISKKMVSDFVFDQFFAGNNSQTIKTRKYTLCNILKSALREELITENPTTGIGIKKPESESEAREPNPFSWDERDRFESVIKDHFPEYYPMVVTGFRTGLRVGELCGLRWDDIDWNKKLIYVENNISRGRETTPKTKSSKRVVRMTTFLLDLLKKHYATALEIKMKRGWREFPKWVFFNSNANFIASNNFREYVWNKAVRKAKLNNRRPHDMRHSYATLRLSSGHSLAEVSKELGHSSGDITYKTYYKFLPQESRFDIDELDTPFRTSDAPTDSGLRAKAI